MEFDLNQEPLDLPHDSMFGLQTLLTELETAGGRIEGRIRQLEAVISRTRQRQLWRQNQTAPQTLVIPVPTTVSEVRSDDAPVSEGVVVPIQGRMFGARESAKKNNTYLIAKALGKETHAKHKRSFFDCNICLDMAREPVLTSCGHLFCWPCFYSCSYIGHSDVKECPVCMEVVVTDKNIIPIYGNENVTNNQKPKLEESGLKVPPRPSAHRIEGLRQKLCNRRAISSLTIRNFQLPTIFAATEERSQSLNSNGAPSTEERSSNSQHVRSQYMHAMQTDGIQQLSRLLERSASFSSLSSALNSAMSSAERLFQDLEASINSHNTRRISRQSSNAFERDSISTLAAILQQESRTLNNSADIDSTVAQIASPSRRTELARISEVSNSIEVNSTAPNSSSSRRRREEVPMSSDVEDDPLRNPIRRRLT